MKLSKKLSVTKTLIVALFLGIIVSPALMMAWKTPITIAGEAGHKYGKPEIKFGPSGTVYMTYRNKVGGNSDITLCTYDGKKKEYENVSNLAEIWSMHDAYESAVYVDLNETIHVTWIGINLSGSHEIHHIMYRYKDENGWSKVFDLGTLNEHEELFDTRIAVDSSGNAHIITMKDAGRTTFYVAVYGDVPTPIVQIGESSCKHPDIIVDDNYVHIIYQKKIGFPYVQMYQKRENKPNGNILLTKQLTHPSEPYASQKGRLERRNDGKLFMLDFYKGGPNNSPQKQLFHYELDTSKGVLNDEILISKPAKMLLYHYAAFAIKGNSQFVSMQLGSASTGGTGLFYNWRKNGQWSGYTYIAGTAKALHNSADLTDDGKIAAVAYITPDNKIHLVSTDTITITGKLEANFSHSDSIFSGSETNFDASECSTLNPDYNIVKYIWNFNGTIKETSSPTIAHTFDVHRTNVKVTLTIQADSSDDTGVIEKTIYINANYNAVNVEKTPMNIKTLIYNRSAYKITWSANTQNSDAGIAKYQIWRSLVTGTMPSNDPNDYKQVGEVSSNTLIHYDYTDVASASNYEYIVRTVDASGNVSPLLNNY